MNGIMKKFEINKIMEKILLIGIGLPSLCAIVVYILLEYLGSLIYIGSKVRVIATSAPLSEPRWVENCTILSIYKDEYDRNVYHTTKGDYIIKNKDFDGLVIVQWWCYGVFNFFLAVAISVLVLNFISHPMIMNH